MLLHYVHHEHYVPLINNSRMSALFVFERRRSVRTSHVDESGTHDKNRNFAEIT